jgi:hypothetical protein
MELITRALAGVVATWIPIEGAEHRKLVPKAKMTGFTSARSRAKDLLLDEVVVGMAQGSRDAARSGQQKPRRVKP